MYFVGGLRTAQETHPAIKMAIARINFFKSGLLRLLYVAKSEDVPKVRSV